MKQITTYFVLFIFFLSPRIKAQDPNIILIIADDMGWNQVSSTSTTFVNGAAHPSDFYETPVLDQLASEGIAFPNGYVNGANCAPTRAALLSGQYAARPHNNIFTVYDLNRGNTASNSNLIGPDMGLASNGNIDEIPASAITIAESMKTEGYATAHFGKYHMGEFEADNVSNNAATDQGFDYNYGGGTTGGPGNYFATESGGVWTFHGNVGPELDPYADPYTEAESIALSIDHANYPLTGTPKHVTDAMTEAAIDFINTEINNPFFMHFSQFAIHGPFGTAHARPDLLAKYQAKKSNNPSSMNHDSDVGQVAIAEGMDQAIGRLIDYLQTTPDPRNGNRPLSENTLVYFIADNGDAIKRSAAKQGQTPLKGMKGEYYEGGIRSITFAWTEPADPIGNPTYTPMLANMGTINQTPVIAFDLYPTFVEAAGGTLPGGGYDIDGVSQWQMLTNGTAMTREALFWHHPGYLIDSKRDSRPVTVVRKGDYKLMHFYEDGHYELYNLVNDLNENTNLLPSGDQAIIDIANDMIDDMTSHLTDTSAPLPTYRDGGATVPMPTYVSASGSNSTAGCQPETGYEAFWDFDTVSDANDASGNNHDPVTVTGSMSYDNIDFREGDQFAIFNGATKVQYNDGTFLNEPKTNRSVSVWLKPDALNGGIQNIYDEGSDWKGITLRLNDNKIQARANQNTGLISAFVEADFDAAMDGEWHHVVLVFEGGVRLTLYVDGVEVATDTTDIPTSKDIAGNAGGIGGVFGSDAFGSNSNTNHYYYNGKMDAFAIYDYVLTLADIEANACLSLSNDDFKEDIGSIYPNPFNDNLNISLKTYSENVTVELFDILGKVTLTNRYANTNAIEIPTSDLAQGLYILRIKTNDGEVIKKVVKE
ncbi:sulfatase-like hydrolase/transferase [Flavobacteriaceae sp. LMIT009]